MNKFIYPLTDVKMQDINLSGGKGMSLCRLKQLSEVIVPDGFIVTTEAYHTLILPSIAELAGGFSKIDPTDINALTAASNKIKETVLSMEFTEEFNTSLSDALGPFGEDALFAVRSSATAEDLPDASFAGQQDSFLNISGFDGIQKAILGCFASLYNVRAISYRISNAYNEKDASMAVVVQKMVPAQAAGVLFTADPMTSDRYTTVIEAVSGLGEELVSGRKIPYTCQIREGKISSERGITPLEKAEYITLSKIGKRIEHYFGCAQDIEWCYLEGTFSIVQSRAITTLFPTPISPDGFKRCYLSVGHMQMMTDVIRPLGSSFMGMLMEFQLSETGGRIFVDITHDLKSIVGRMIVRKKAAAMDPLMMSAVQEILKRKQYRKAIPKGEGSFKNQSNYKLMLPMVRESIRIYKRNDTKVIDTYLRQQKNLLVKAKKSISLLSGSELIHFIETDHKRLTEAIYDEKGMGSVVAVQYVMFRINQFGKRLLGEENITNRLSKSVNNNVTSEMGLAFSELADTAREYPEVIAYLEGAGNTFSFQELRKVTGGDITADAFKGFLKQYGMRCTGEIDISKPRFREMPAMLLPSLLTNIKTLQNGHGKTLFEKGLKENKELTTQLLQKTKKQFGMKKALLLKKYISFYRDYVGLREYPKYFWICRYDIYKRGLMKEAANLKKQGIIQDVEDIFYLHFDELKQMIEDHKVDYNLIIQRKKDYEGYETLTPPRVIFSDGEVVTGTYKKNIPKNALGGLGVSSGIAEGRARVITTMEDAKLEQGDILVTTFTDPSWTPLFVSVAGLVTEVGGMMTHGAVITREYGLPAVVGVEGATSLIRDGDRIRVNGDKGFVEILT